MFMGQAGSIHMIAVCGLASVQSLRTSRGLRVSTRKPHTNEIASADTVISSTGVHLCSSQRTLLLTLRKLVFFAPSSTKKIVPVGSAVLGMQRKGAFVCSFLCTPPVIVSTSQLWSLTTC